MAKQAMPKYEQESHFSEHVAQRLREGIFIITVALSLFLFFALLTYSRTDPGWSYTGSGASIHNAGGRVGAWVADVFFYSFGYLAYVFPLLITYGAFLLLRNTIAEYEGDTALTVLRIIGFLLILTAGCGLVGIEIPQAQLDLPFMAGGVMGQLIGAWLLHAFNMLGSSLLLLAVLLTGVTLYTNLSWLQVIDVVGRVTLWVFECVLEGSESVRDKISDWRDNREAKPAPVKKVREAKLRQPRLKPLKAEPDARKPIAIKRPQSAATLALNPALKRKPALLKQGVVGTMPSIDLLDPAPQETSSKSYSNAVLENMSREVEQRLNDFNVQAQVVAVHPGPVITRFELQLAPGVKVSKITGLAKDLARSLSVVSVRVVEVIPGKSVIGLELPNEGREVVRLSAVLESSKFENAKSPLSLALGKDIAGHAVIVDLAKMPHLLVAGTTGSGKSVGLNAMLLSLLYKSTPEEVRMILIDPKMLELSVYEGIPHLLAPVVTDMKEAASALRWCVAEMERRYKLMAALGVRNLTGFNNKIREAQKAGQPIIDPLWSASPESEEEPPELEPLPYIMVLVDEFADMMMVVGKKVEELIARIAQKARAAGIHLILATQRPSVDVITGLIKANIPTRIAFQVSSRIDSRTILDQQGAEQLLGQGDMLYLPPGGGVPIRVHGAFVDDHEVHAVVNDWQQRGQPEYIEAILQCNDPKEGGFVGADGSGEDMDPLYDQAIRIVTETRKASISSIQRRLKIGFNRAARLLEQMEQDGVVSTMEGNGQREVLAPPPVEL